MRDKLSGLLRSATWAAGRLRHRRPARRRLPAAARDPTFVKRVERADTRVLDLVRDARGEAGTEQRELERLAARQARERTAVLARRNALASITAGLRERRDTIARAHAARVAALDRTRSGRRKAERELSRLLAARARAARAPSTSGGPWAIPWPIVQCESGGQNLPPNHAGASGYYQFMQATWKGLGGSTPHAYQASKAEQDRLAARLWAGGAGRTTGSAPTSCSRDTVPTVRELSDLPGWAQALLEETRVAHLGLLDEQGAPRVQPITFARVGETLVSAIDDKPKRTTPARIARLRSDPRATVTIDRYDDDWTRLAWVQVLADGAILDLRRRGARGAPARYPAYRDTAARPADRTFTTSRPLLARERVCSPDGLAIAALAPPSSRSPAAALAQDEEDRCGPRKQGEQCGEGNGRQTPGGGNTGNVSHKGWPKITGILWKVLDSRDHERTGTEDNDELLGHHGDDTIYGLDGKDVLWGDWEINNPPTRPT